VAILLAIQSVWAPFHYVLLFGAYESDFPNVVLRAGLVVLVMRTLSTEEGQLAPATAAPVALNRTSPVVAT